MAAADSAASVGGKRFTADKVFEVLDGKPVCMMAYGMADICTVPVEVVVEEYRRSRAGLSFPTIEAVAKDFEKFLDSDECLSITERHRQIHAANMLRRCVTELTRRAREDGIEDRDLVGYLSWTLHELEAETGHESSPEEAEWLEGCADATGDSEQMQGNRIWRNGKARDMAVRIATVMPYSEDNARYTGLVFAGYGDDERMPGYCEYHITGISKGGILRNDGSSGGIDAGKRSCILSYARDDVARSLVDGMNPQIRDIVLSMVLETIRRSIRKINTPTTARDIELKQSDRIEIVNGIMETFDQILYDGFRNPMEDVVSHLHLTEMTALAGIMIMATAACLHISWDFESVGGPIDIVNVTRQHGFRWVERDKY
ncbi:MAG: hypothetical protein Q4Q58_04590 [Thermoplasmata archaeon]|nr:hypothetical protein [Thermoplasmata archaeon]